MSRFKTFNTNTRALIVGASGGIGRAVTLALGDICGPSGVITASRSADGLEITDEASVREFSAGLDGRFDLILIATGALELDGQGPEKTIMAMTPEALRAQFDINALGPALLIKHLHAFLPDDRRGVIAVLSARVASIGDNRLGGWISYRASKAALNQIVHTAAIEIARRRSQAICVALHPGTVRTSLTRKYVGNNPAVGPEEAASNLLGVLDGLVLADSGGFFDWRGDRIVW
jgi:NAD(P)-dependent dehydrogenase (short-subunit alcohol dehydrogenase family)